MENRAGKNEKGGDAVMSVRLSKRHQRMILILLAVIVLAVIGHLLFRPDRYASLQIIYTGDMQGQLAYEAGMYAGYEKVAALADEASDGGSRVLLLDAGNCLGGSVNSELDDGSSVISLMNTVGYDAMVPGPMDFIYGVDALSSLRAQASFPILAANIKKADGSSAFETYKILTINSVRIGVIGVTLGLSQAQADRESLTVADPVEAVKDVLSQMSGRMDAVIVLAYTGSEEVTQALADIEGVSMVVESGMSGAFFEQTEKGTLIASAGQAGRTIGLASLDISRDDTVIENSFCDASEYDLLSSDEKTAEAVTHILQNRSSAEAVVVGSVALAEEVPESVDEEETDSEETDDAETDGAETDEMETAANTAETSDASDEAVPDTDAASVTDTGIYHRSETPTGNLTADAMLDGASADGAVVALIRDQSIQGTLTSGSVSFGQICNLFDDNMYLVTCRMTGGELRLALENSFEGYPKARDFLQVSGISYTYNSSTAIGSRLSDMVIDGHNLDDARTYVVAMTNSLADTLGCTSEATGRVSNYRTIASVLQAYIQKQSTLNAPISETGGTDTSDTDTVSDDSGTDGGTAEADETKRITIQ